MGDEGFIKAVEEEEEFGEFDGVSLQNGAVCSAEGREEGATECFGYLCLTE